MSPADASAPGTSGSGGSPGGAGPSEPGEALDLSSLVPLFVAESQERLARMELALLTLEEQPEDRDALDEVFRTVHTIKGDAATIGLKDLADFAHRVEDALDRLRGGHRQMSATLATYLLRTVDVLRELVAETGGGPPRRRDDLAPVLEGVMALLDDDDPADTADPQVPSHRDAGPPSFAELGGGTLRIEVARVDELLDLAGELVAARSQLLAALEEDEPERGRLLELTSDSERLYADLQEQVMRLRMVPVGPTLRRFQRMVRDQALALGKEATLDLDGTEVELDSSVLQRLREPLSHLLRNALAHGIEPVAERLAKGKEPTGRIRLRTRRQGGVIAIEVSDDGRGLDRERIVERARRLGLLASDRQPEDREALQLVFAPGLSTAQTVSDVAGRGVGLDVVKRAVEALRGTVEASSNPGAGTTVSLRLPLTLAVIDALHVTASGQVFVLPLDAVDEVVELPAGALPGTQATAVVELRDRDLTCVTLSDLLGLERDDRGPIDPRRQIVVLRHAGPDVGLVVDNVLGKSQDLIKPLPKLLSSAPGLSGTVVLADGALAIVLDLGDLLRRRGLAEAGRPAPTRLGPLALLGGSP